MDGTNSKKTPEVERWQKVDFWMKFNLPQNPQFAIVKIKTVWNNNIISECFDFYDGKLWNIISYYDILPSFPDNTDSYPRWSGLSRATGGAPGGMYDLPCPN